MPIIMISGVGEVSDAVKAMKAGAFNFLQKPANPEDILSVIKEALSAYDTMAMRDKIEAKSFVKV